MAGDVVGVRVRLDRSYDPKPAPLGLVEQRLDRKRRIDEHGDAGFVVSHEVTRTSEIAVQELVEDHDATVAPGPAITLEVIACGRRGGRRRSRARPRRPRRWRPTGAPSVRLHPRRAARSGPRSTSPCGCRCSLRGGEAVRPGANLRRDPEGKEVVVRSRSRPPVHVTDEPLTSAFQPGGEEADSIETPGGASTESETVSLGGRSLGVSNVISVSTPSSTNDGWMVTWAYAAAGRINATAVATHSFLTEARDAVRSPSAEPRSCPPRSRGSSGRGTAGRLRTRR